VPQEEIDGFMARLFDKDSSTARPDDLPLPYSSDNPPSLVRITILLIILDHAINIFLWLVIQDLYPTWEIDAELSDEDNNGQNEPASDDARGEGAPSVESLTPNPIGSSLAGESRPSAADRITSTAPSGGGQKKKPIVLKTKRKRDKVPTDQAIIELPPYRGPRSPLDLVVVEHIFGRLFEAFWHVSQAARTDTSIGDDAQPSKRARVPLLRRILVPKYVMILLAYSAINFDPHSDNMALHRNSSVSGPPKPANKQVTAPKTATFVAATAASPSAGGTGRTILSTADA
jgi:hypothetical protein